MRFCAAGTSRCYGVSGISRLQSGAVVTFTGPGVLNLTGSGWDNITSVQFGETVKGFGVNVIFDDMTFNGGSSPLCTIMHVAVSHVLERSCPARI